LLKFLRNKQAKYCHVSYIYNTSHLAEQSAADYLAQLYVVRFYQKYNRGPTAYY